MLSRPCKFPISSCLLCDWPTQVTDKPREGQSHIESRTPNFPHFTLTTSPLPSGQLSHLAKSQHPLRMPGERTRVTPQDKASPCRVCFWVQRCFRWPFSGERASVKGAWAAAESLAPEEQEQIKKRKPHQEAAAERALGQPPSPKRAPHSA